MSAETSILTSTHIGNSVTLALRDLTTGQTVFTGETVLHRLLLRETLTTLNAGGVFVAAGNKCVVRQLHIDSHIHIRVVAAEMPEYPIVYGRQRDNTLPRVCKLITHSRS